MTYRELHFREKVGFGHAETEHESLIRDFVANQSPIMKIWFLVMFVNMLLILLVNLV